MKTKITLAIAFAALSLASCTKSYTCEEKYDNYTNGVSDNKITITTYTYDKLTEAQKEELERTKSITNYESDNTTINNITTFTCK